VAKFEKSTTAPTHYGRIYIEMGLVIYTKEVNKVENCEHSFILKDLGVSD